MNSMIDYSGESTEGEPSSWSHKAFKKYYIETYLKVHSAGGAVPWTIKEQVLLSKILSEYSADDVANMILFWHTNTAKPSIAYQFNNFYACRHDTFHKMKRATSDYKWD